MLRPVINYYGHVNSTEYLRFSTDYNENILFAGPRFPPLVFRVYLLFTKGGQDKSIRVWDIKTGKLLKTLGPFKAPVRSVAYGETWQKDKDLGSTYQPGIWVADGPVLGFYSVGTHPDGEE